MSGIFDSRIRSLADSARQLLLLASLDGSGDLRVLQAASTTPRGLADLEAAQKAELVSINGDSHRVTFRHPLIRAAVVAIATGEERREAHRTLAMALTASRSDEPGTWPRLQSSPTRASRGCSRTPLIGSSVEGTPLVL